MMSGLRLIRIAGLLALALATLVAPGGQAFAAAPTVSSVFPNTGSISGGTSVAITGSGFTNGTATVYFGGTAALSVTVNNDSSITAISPAGSGTVNVTVNTSGAGGGTSAISSADQFTYVGAPTVGSVSPSSGPPGTSVTITGTNFIVGFTTVQFGLIAATSISVDSSSQITATAPAGGVGPVDVTVSTSVGTSAKSSSDQFSYINPPNVTSITPTTGVAGASVAINGSGFTGVTSVKFGSNPAASFTINSDSLITATVPTGSGTVGVTVQNSQGTSTLGSAFTYLSVTSISPSSGPASGGTTVMILGTGFTGVTAVKFGTTVAAFAVNSPTSITATAPSGSGSVDVTVTTAGGTSATSPADQFTYVAAPTVTSINPTSGPVAGATSVAITGTGFFGGGLHPAVSAVKFGNNAAASFTVNSDTSITATSPAGTLGTVNVTITTLGGTSATGPSSQFTYTGTLVTSISPTSGLAGTTVTITGTGFTGATASSVKFGSTPATSLSSVTNTQIIAIAPAGSGTVDVTVTTPSGTSPTVPADEFTYSVAAPTVTAISPSSGPAGTSITITGTNFAGKTTVAFGTNPATEFTVDSTTMITATAPPGTGIVDVTVTTPGGTSGTGSADKFTYAAASTPAPTVTSISPTNGSPAGGTLVTITGTNFTGATAVNFGSTPVTSGFTVNGTGTSITVNSPPGTGTVDVTVTTPSGTSAPSSGDRFTYGKAATSLTLTSSPNPSVYGQAVTFTATVTGNNPTGTVAFSEGGKQIGTAPLVHATATTSTATFTISSLPVGADLVTASYGGDANNASDPGTVTQNVDAPADSIKLREMQVAAMPVVANVSGQTISGAIDNAIGAGFSGSCPTAPTPNGSGFTYCFTPEPQAQLSSAPDRNDAALLPPPPDQHAMLDHDFKALGYADAQPGFGPPLRAAPSALPSNWIPWIDFRATSFERTPTGDDLIGWQVNTMTGLSRRFSEDFLIGVTGGYEHFDYSSQAYNGVLRGNGLTGGAYLGWRLTPTLRFEVAGTWSDIVAADASGSASGNFTGTRWLAFGGLTGTYSWLGIVFDPSAQVFTLWEHENAYTDSLGTLQPNHDFDTGLAKGGFKISYPFVTSFGVLAPYVGLYGEYYFSMDNAATIGLTTVPLLQGWAARATGGLTVTFAGGAQVGAGLELDGIGNNFLIWTASLRGSVPF